MRTAKNMLPMQISHWSFTRVNHLKKQTKLQPVGAANGIFHRFVFNTQACPQVFNSILNKEKNNKPRTCSSWAVLDFSHLDECDINLKYPIQGT